MKTDSRILNAFLWLIVVLLAATLVLYEVYRNPKYQLFGELVSRVETEQKVVALTFDDGPKIDSTQTLLGMLKQENVLATFFLNGGSMSNNPRETKLIIDAGHQVANHGYSHRRLAMMPYDEIASEIEDTSKIIRDAGYTGDIVFRPPYGKSLFLLPYYLHKHDLISVTWDVEAETFRDGEDTSDQIVQRTLEQVRPGSIIIMHVMYGDGESLNAVPSIIHGLKMQGYSFVTVDKLLSMRKP